MFPRRPTGAAPRPAGPKLARVREPTTAGPWSRSAVLRRAGHWAVRLGVVLAGAWLGILMLGRVAVPIGPFDATVAFRPFGGGATLDIPPLGALQADAYDGPLRLEIQLSRVDEVRASALATDPSRLDGVVDRVNADLRDAVERVAWLTALAAVSGATTASLLVLRRRREPLIALGLSTALVAGIGGLAAATWRPGALSQPTYTGLLVNANSLIGSAEDLVARFDAYRASLEDLVSNVSTLYSTLSTLPAPGGTGDSVALLHVSDLHLNPAGFDLVRQVVTQFEVDGILDSGDITDWGSQPENGLIRSVGTLGVPYVSVRGNHDSAVTAGLLAAQPNVTVLDDSAVTVAGIRIVGASDPRFTPDRDASGGASLEEAGEGLAAFARSLADPPALALVHDPQLAQPLDGVVPLVLAGHRHEREITRLEGGTLLRIEGSTGGAGLRALQGEYPEPLTCTVLYLERGSGTLTAYDEITLGGLGETEVTIERTVLDPAVATSEDGAPSGPTSATTVPVAPTTATPPAAPASPPG